MNQNNKAKGFSYTLEKAKLEEFSKLSYEQRLDWIVKMHRFLKKFMPDESLAIWQKFRTGEV